MDWLVVGGGPTGICAVGALLQRAGEAGFGRIGWVEKDSFDKIGRLSLYGSVPANTRNDRIVEAMESLDAFEFSRAQAARPSDSRLSTRPTHETSKLQFSIDALRDASQAIRSSGRLALCRDGLLLKKLSNDSGNLWTAETASNESVSARRVILTTGGAPRPPASSFVERCEELHIQVLQHDDVVAPAMCDALRESLPSCLAIVGGAHSGMLAAQNFLRTKEDDKKASVSVFDRKPRPRFAEERDGWIKYDGTGLKGTVAAWTRDSLESKDPRLSYETVPETYDDLLKVLVERDIEAVVFCCGFDKVASPTVTFKNKPVDIASPTAHDPRTGKLAPGLHGLGIAYPEFWTDQDGYTEPRVGFVCHYLQHIDRALHQAIQDTAET